MSDKERDSLFDPDNPLSLPVLDTEDMLEHTTGVWGQFKFDESKTYGLHKNEVPGIANEWVKVCDSALRGKEIVDKLVNDNILVIDLSAVESLNYLTQRLGHEIPYRERMNTIEKSRRAFLYLTNPDLVEDLSQKDVDSAQLLVSKVDKFFKPLDISIPSK